MTFFEHEADENLIAYKWDRGIVQILLKQVRMQTYFPVGLEPKGTENLLEPENLP